MVIYFIHIVRLIKLLVKTQKMKIIHLFSSKISQRINFARKILDVKSYDF